MVQMCVGIVHHNTGLCNVLYNLYNSVGDGDKDVLGGWSLYRNKWLY